MKIVDGPAQLARQVIAAYLVAATGLDLRSVDDSRLQWTIESRCRHLHLRGDATAYAEYLKSSPEELDALIDSIVVQETRFFRDPAVFKHLAHWLPQMAADFPGELRILSAPCSTGQEAYSLAATFEQAGVPLSRVLIDAFDISHSALATARHGVFPEEALRHVPPEQQRVCGTLRDKRWTMHDKLRARIRFERRNLAEPNALSAAPQYHLILCRNLFIYLRPEARTALAQSLASALMPGGRLVLGSADRVEELSTLFSPQKPAASFAFTHRSTTAPPVTTHPQTRPKRSVVTRSAKPLAIAPNTLPATSATAAELYRRAIQHREHRQLRKAERACRQALYLDPHHLPALELLSALWHHHQPHPRLRLALEARIYRTTSRVHAEVAKADDKETL